MTKLKERLRNLAINFLVELLCQVVPSDQEWVLTIDRREDNQIVTIVKKGADECNNDTTTPSQEPH